MTTYLFFYGAGWTFQFIGAALLLLVLGECVAEGAVSYFRTTASWLVYVFLAVACIHTCGWLLEKTGVLDAKNAYEHYKLANARLGFWLEIAAVFAPMGLWVPAAREQPAAVLCISAASIAAWVAALCGYYFGIWF